MKSERPVLGSETGRRGALVCGIATSIPDVAGYNNVGKDPGELGIIAQVERLSEIEAFYQYEDLRMYPPDFQASARVRVAALRRRLFAEEVVR